MKKMNLLVMSLVSAAALSFTSCSSNDDLDGNAGQAKVDGFYMTLTIQTPNSNGTRTSLKNDFAATPAESDVTSGTFYLVDANNKIVFTHTITKEEWAEKKIPTQSTNGKTTLQVPVKNVTAGTTYSVYFLANATSKSPLTDVFTSDNKFATEYSKANNFAMFNENDADVKGNSHTVVFTSDNKDANSAAKVSSTINIERLTARIDEPKSEATAIKNYDDVENAKPTPEQKTANEDALKAVESVKLTRYAISNVANKTNVMQQWADATTLSIPTSITYFQPTSEFGTKTLLQNYGYFNAVTTDKSQKDYVFENNNENAATSMYFEYTVTLNDDLKAKADFKDDGTFYRYNKVIYSNIQDIIDAYKDQKAIFDGKDAKTVVDELKAAKADPDSEAKLDEFRKKYDIEVFNSGKTYYVQKIKDQYLGVENTIQRNSIYLLNVKNIFNVGAQVPNGGPDDRTLYYLDVEVSVNPWVLNTQNVDFK